MIQTETNTILNKSIIYKYLDKVISDVYALTGEFQYGNTDINYQQIKNEVYLLKLLTIDSNSDSYLQSTFEYYINNKFI